MHNKFILSSQLQVIGLNSGDTIMLHASMRAIGKEVENPNHVIQSIIDVVGLTGTLMMYIGCEPEYEAVGRDKYTSEQESEILKRCSAFDPEISPARPDYGIIAEFFRKWPGVICSSNPGARIAALGDQAQWITADH